MRTVVLALAAALVLTVVAPATAHGEGCPAGYAGTPPHCIDVDDCASWPCGHGTCTDRVNGYACTCDPGYEGTNCNHRLPDCTSDPCVHGVCTDGLTTYTCTCDPGFGGKNCDRKVDDSAQNPSFFARR